MSALARMKARLKREREEQLLKSIEGATHETTTNGSSEQDSKSSEQNSATTKYQMAAGTPSSIRSNGSTSHSSTTSGGGGSNNSGLRASSEIYSTIATAVAAPAPELGKADVTYDLLNTQQKLAVQMAVEGHSFCLIGAAGSGKTTTVKAIAAAVIKAGIARRMGEGETTDKFFAKGMHSIIIASFTNQAVRNIRSSMPPELQANCTTLHNLVEFVPVEYEDPDQLDEFGNATRKQVFAPNYGTLWNQAVGWVLPHTDLIVIEESGSVALELFELLVSALPRPEDTQFIFLGDLNQLPPVFDDAILGFKQLELPVVELTEVYRNVGIITKLAHRILEGKPISDKEALTWNQVCPETGDSINFTRYTKKYSAEQACQQMGLWLKKRIVSGDFSPENTMVLVPYNKSFGTIELNKYIMQGISERDDLEVYEVEARGIKTYHSIGDRVLHAKNYYTIANITLNLKYTGKRLEPSKYLTRFGTALKGKKDLVFGAVHSERDTTDVEDLLNMSMAEVEHEGVQSSYTLTLEPLEVGGRVQLSSGAINNLLPAYALTVHKAQGSEAERVMLLLHHSHSNMAVREILYTGITRARHHLDVYYSGNYTDDYKSIGTSMLYKCLVNQKIKGNTAKEKLQYFRRRARDYIAGGGKGAMLAKLKQLKDNGEI